MKKKICYILLSIFFLSKVSMAQKIISSIVQEKNVALFSNFKTYVLNAIQRKEDINDTAHLNYILSHYIFLNKQPASEDKKNVYSAIMDADQLKNIRAELNIFYDYLREGMRNKMSESLTVRHIRSSTDSLIYDQLSQFQKRNCYVLFDQRFPDKILGYVLFMPPLRGAIDSPRIWSWTLVFKFGKIMFKAFTGEEGSEYLFNRN